MKKIWLLCVALVICPSAYADGQSITYSGALYLQQMSKTLQSSFDDCADRFDTNPVVVQHARLGLMVGFGTGKKGLFRASGHGTYKDVAKTIRIDGGDARGCTNTSSSVISQLVDGKKMQYTFNSTTRCSNKQLVCVWKGELEKK